MAMGMDKENNQFPKLEDFGHYGGTWARKTVLGVMTYCSGEQLAIPGPESFRSFAPIVIGINHDIFLHGELVPVPNKIGLDLLCLQTQPLSMLLGSATRSRPELMNRVAAYLMIDPVTCVPAPKWQNNAGNALFVRRDMKPLGVEHFEALWMFNDRILDLFDEGKGAAQEMMTRKRWDQFWYEYKREQIAVIELDLNQEHTGNGQKEGAMEAWMNSDNPLTI